MNPRQEKFYEFILERVQEDKVENAKALLSDSFKKQEEGTFTQEEVVVFIPKMISLLKPEKVEEVKNIMKQFSQNIHK
ncbi:hypothetical protein [Clostridium sp. UBA1652]|uniref:hypothetical protein n=1 Tax=Clostridium sp. UBA1652 TaxID=1946348 RepID=UPI00257CDD9B|nr:hypothetical protein [Clostridium sp. UBA1652]